MALPKRIVIHELGPREGMQIEKNPIDTSEKIRLASALRVQVSRNRGHLVREPQVGAANG